VQAAFATFGFTQPSDSDVLYSLGGISDTAIFTFYRNAEPITRFTQFRGKRVAIGMPRTGLRTLMSEVLKATGAFDDSIRVSDLDYGEAIDALIAGEIDVAMVPSQVDDPLVQRAFDAPGVQLMNVAQAEAIAKTVPGLTRVVLWQGVVNLTRDIPNSDIDMLALRNRVLVRRDLQPALQYLLLGAMREVHAAPSPFNRLGEFPAEQSNDLPLSPTAEAFYRAGTTFWQRYTSFWLSSLLNRIVFFIIPVMATLIPLIGFGPRFYRWLMFGASTGCIGPSDISRATLFTAWTHPDWSSTRHGSRTLTLTYGRSRLRAPSKSICSGSDFICAWCKTTLAGWRRCIASLLVTLWRSHKNNLADHEGRRHVMSACGPSRTYWHARYCR
jgi:hypothetical protein